MTLTAKAVRGLNFCHVCGHIGEGHALLKAWAGVTRTKRVYVHANCLLRQHDGWDVLRGLPAIEIEKVSLADMATHKISLATVLAAVRNARAREAHVASRRQAKEAR